PQGPEHYHLAPSTAAHDRKSPARPEMAGDRLLLPIPETSTIVVKALVVELFRPVLAGILIVDVTDVAKEVALQQTQTEAVHAGFNERADRAAPDSAGQQFTDRPIEKVLPDQR